MTRPILRRPARALPTTAVVALLLAGASPLTALGASPSAPPVTGTWLDGLATGVCFDTTTDAQGYIDFSVPATVVPCEQSHQDEVAALVPLGDGDDFPAEQVEALATQGCDAATTAFLGRPIGDTILFPLSIWPDERDWAAGARWALCAVTGSDPLIGTAASGDLRAPGETLAAFL